MTRNLRVCGFLGLACAGLDWATKAICFSRLRFGEEVQVIPGFFSITPALNPGTLWSLGRGLGTLWLVISVLAVPALVCLIASVKRPGWVPRVSLGLILGGAIGNMIDRVREGAVRDFIKVYVERSDGPPWVWPIFNLADSFIVVGAFLLAAESLLPQGGHESPRPAIRDS